MDLLKRSNTKKSDRVAVSRKGSIKASDGVPKFVRGKANSVTASSVGEEEEDTTGTGAVVENLRYATVIREYTAKEGIEVNLEEGTIVTILPQCVTDDKPNFEMLMGFSNGTKGIFPADCVKILSEEEAADEGLGSDNIAGELKDQAKTGQKKGWFARYVLVGQTGTESPVGSKDNIIVSAPSRTTTNPTITSHSSPNLLTISVPASVDTTPVISPSSSNNPNKRPFRLPGQRMLWSDYMGGPEEVAKLNLTKQELKRQEVIYEIITTEADYIQDLETVLELYIRPLQKSKLIRPKDMACIFSNIEQFLPVNEELLRELECKQADNPVINSVGKILIGMSDYLKMYTMYCSNHPYAVERLQALRQTRAIAKFLDDAAHKPQSRAMDLSSFLLKPIQRVCKYPLLLRDLIKSTDEKHPDYENLTKAMGKIETVVAFINEGARQAENVHKMIELQSKFSTKVSLVAPSRFLVKSGSVKIFNAQHILKTRELYIFNDMLIVAKQEGEKYKLMTMAEFDALQINMLKHSADGFSFQVEIIHINQETMILEFDNENARETWYNVLKSTMATFLEQKNRIEQANAIPIKVIEDGTLHSSGEDEQAKSPTKVYRNVITADSAGVEGTSVAPVNRPSNLKLELEQALHNRKSSTSDTPLSREPSVTPTSTIHLKKVAGSPVIARSPEVITFRKVDTPDQTRHILTRISDLSESDRIRASSSTSKPSPILQHMRDPSSKEISKTSSNFSLNGPSSEEGQPNYRAFSEDSVNSKGSQAQAIDAKSLANASTSLSDTKLPPQKPPKPSSPMKTVFQATSPTKPKSIELPENKHDEKFAISEPIPKLDVFEKLTDSDSTKVKSVGAPPPKPSGVKPTISTKPTGLASKATVKGLPSASIQAQMSVFQGGSTAANPPPPPVPTMVSKPTMVARYNSQPILSQSSESDASLKMKEKIDLPPILTNTPPPANPVLDLINKAKSNSSIPTGRDSSNNSPSCHASNDHLRNANSIEHLKKSPSIEVFLKKPPSNENLKQQPPIAERAKIFNNVEVKQLPLKSIPASKSSENMAGGTSSTPTGKLTSVATENAKPQSLKPIPTRSIENIPTSISVQVSNSVGKIIPVVISNVGDSETEQVQLKKTMNLLKRTQTEMGKPLTLNRPIKAGTIHEIAKSVKGSAYTYYYNILITYASGDPGKIYKKYEDFVELHMQLLGHFPEAAGGAQSKNVQILLDQKSENRILPEIPPQVLVVTDSIAQSRAVNLQHYIDTLLVLPPKISRSPLVFKFFKTVN